MAPRRDHGVYGQSALLAVFAGLIVFCGRSALVFHAGSPVPLHDQWIAEGAQLFVHDVRHTLSWHNFLIPIGDHLPVMTRLIAFLLYRLSGRWDTLAEMLVNNAIIAAAFAAMLHHSLRLAPNRLVACAGLIVAVWLASPLFYGNALWGFQSQIELLVLTAVLQVAATASLSAWDGRWWLGTVAGVVGFFSFGSAVAASAVCLGICAWRWRDREVARPALIGAAIVNLALIGGAVALLARSPSLGGGGIRLPDVLHTAAHAFSWPAMYPTWFAWLIWLPSLVVIPIAARARAPAPLAIAALAVWTALQIGGIAVTRSLPVPVLAPRYYDIFAVGIVANGVLGAWFVRASAGRGPILAAAILGLCAWSIYVGFSGWRFARSHTRLDVPAMRAIADGQIDLLQRYYGGEGATVLRSAKFPVLPYPEPAYLENLLPEPAIRNSLPVFIVSPSAGDKGCNLAQRSWPGESGLRRASWLWISLGLGTLALGGYLAVAIRAAPLQPTQDTR